MMFVKRWLLNEAEKRVTRRDLSDGRGMWPPLPVLSLARLK